MIHAFIVNGVGASTDGWRPYDDDEDAVAMVVVGNQLAARGGGEGD